MQPIQHISVIGAGAWGTALAKHLAEKGLQTILWAYERDVLESIASSVKTSSSCREWRFPYFG